MALTGYWSGGTYYHNTPEYASALQAEIARQNGGKTLELPVILAWLAHEGQAKSNATDTNPLNIQYPGHSGSGLETGHVGVNNTYATPEAGLQATAHLILHGPYAGIRATLAPIGKGDPIAQAQAIQDSPWAYGHYGGELVGAVKRLVAAGVTTVSNVVTTTVTVPGPNTGGSSDMAPVAAVVPNVTLDVLFVKLSHGADLFGPNDTLTADNLKFLHLMLFGDGSPMNTGLGGVSDKEKTDWYNSLKLGTPLGKIVVPIGIAKAFGISIASGAAGPGLVGVGPTDPKTGAYVGPGSSFFDFGPFLAHIADPENWLYGIAVIAGAILFYKGYTALGITSPT